MKRISIKITGHEFITAFENDKKTQANHPDYKGDGVAVWIHEYEPKTTEKINVSTEKIE